MLLRRLQRELQIVLPGDVVVIKSEKNLLGGMNLERETTQEAKAEFHVLILISAHGATSRSFCFTMRTSALLHIDRAQANVRAFRPFKHDQHPHSIREFHGALELNRCLEAILSNNGA